MTPANGSNNIMNEITTRYDEQHILPQDGEMDNENITFLHSKEETDQTNKTVIMHIDNRNKKYTETTSDSGHTTITEVGKTIHTQIALVEANFKEKRKEIED